MFERAAPFRRARQIAVVAEGQLALVAVDHDRLRVHQGSVAGGRVARVPERRVAGKARKHFGLKNIGHQAHAFFEMQFAPVARNDSGRFLAAMLQRVEAEVSHLRGFGMAEDAAHAAVIVEPVVLNLIRRFILPFGYSCSARLQAGIWHCTIRCPPEGGRYKNQIAFQYFSLCPCSPDELG